SHLYEPGLHRDDYIARSGGLTKQADRRRVYVVHANGEVVTEQQSGWFRHTSADEMRPGDTIVVPIDAERMAPIARWAAVSQIVYQLALAAASAHWIGVLWAARLAGAMTALFLSRRAGGALACMLILSASALADPWLAPGDPALRHDVQLLSDLGVL